MNENTDVTTSPPPSAQPAVAPNDSPGATGTLPDAGFAARIERADADATEQFFAESKKPNRTRGPDKRPRRPRTNAPAMALDDVDHDAGASDLVAGPAVPLAPEVPLEAAFDEAAATAMVTIALGLLNDGAQAIVAAVAKKETGDDALAREAGLSVRMGANIEAAIRRGAIDCAKKYSVRTQYSPEIMLFGGLVIWGGQVTVAIKGLKAKGAELRQQPRAPMQEAP